MVGSLARGHATRSCHVIQIGPSTPALFGSYCSYQRGYIMKNPHRHFHTKVLQGKSLDQVTDEVFWSHRWPASQVDPIGRMQWSGGYWWNWFIVQSFHWHIPSSRTSTDIRAFAPSRALEPMNPSSLTRGIITLIWSDFSRLLQHESNVSCALTALSILW